MSNPYYHLYSMSYTFDPVTGNLLQRKDNKNNLTEDFSYDTYLLNSRLTEWGENSHQKYYTLYAHNGNILGKTDGDLITELEIEYGPDDSRKITRLYETTGARQRTLKKEKHFVMGNYEEIVDDRGNKRKLHYITGEDGLFAIFVKNQENDTMYYVQKDYLGSYEMVNDETGSVINRQSFDPWGRKRNPQNRTYANSPWPDLFDRGFTGHEHLDKFDLINMNGRMYEPPTSSSFSAA